MAATVAEIWRYPVKSMQGEQLEVGSFDALGLAGDRRWALRDARTGKLVSAKQDRLILTAGARLSGDRVDISLPGGPADLSEWIGRPVSLEHAGPGDAGAYEMYLDPEDETSESLDIGTPAGTFLDAGAVHILTTSTLRAMAALHPGSVWDARRFRPTLLVECDEDGFVEDGWVGRPFLAGTAQMTVVLPTLRCGMPGREQPGLEADTEVVRAVKQSHNSLLGVYATVDVPGEVRAGDELVFL